MRSAAAPTRCSGPPAAEREARARAAARRERLVREGRVAEAVGRGVTVVLQRLEVSVAAAAEERSAVEQARRGREEDLMAVRARLRDLGKEHDELVNTVHRDEMARTQQRMRIEQLEERTLEELGVDVDSLVAEYGPQNLVPPVQTPEQVAAQEADEDAVPPEPVPYVREEQQKRLRSAERALSMLGKVNPLALEEFTALEERHQFLGEQLEDLRKTRRDLLDIVREVDERVEQVFTEAWNDVNTAFDGVFKRLFPGGEGRLVLTDPSNMLTTGIEVEARPPGKKVKRLSLLSGGERSLVAVAFLVSLFKARPSPFYILDEVEAALDDTNLGRLLRDLRGAAREQPAAGDHPPEADHGGRRRAVRRHHARRRRLRGDQPAAARGRACMSERAPRPTRGDYVVWRRATTRWADDDAYGHMNNATLLRAVRHRGQRPPVRGHRHQRPGAAVDRRGRGDLVPLLPRDRLPRARRHGAGRRAGRHLLGDLPDRAVPGRRRTRPRPRAGSCTCTSTTPNGPGDRPVRPLPEEIRAVVTALASGD